MLPAPGPLLRRARPDVPHRPSNPATRWPTQADPIGLLGGLNQYGLAGSDPIGNSDPFGLTVCFHGNQQQRPAAADEYVQATGTKFALDGAGCTRGATRDASSGVSEAISKAFIQMAESAITFTTSWGRIPGIQAHERGSGLGWPAFNAPVFYIDQSDVGHDYGTAVIPGPTETCSTSPGATYSLHQIIVHEVGEMHGFIARSGTSEDWALMLETFHLIDAQKPLRHPSCHKK